MGAVGEDHPALKHIGELFGGFLDVMGLTQRDHLLDRQAIGIG